MATLCRLLVCNTLGGWTSFTLQPLQDGQVAYPRSPDEGFGVDGTFQFLLQPLERLEKGWVGLDVAFPPWQTHHAAQQAGLEVSGVANPLQPRQHFDPAARGGEVADGQA